jgi:hypothetical protein
MSSFPTPQHLHDAPRALALSFWTLVVFSLGMVVAFAVVASVDPVASPLIGGAILVLAVLWGVHVRSVRSHRAEIASDPRFHAARERRGF